LVWM